MCKDIVLTPLFCHEAMVEDESLRVFIQTIITFCHPFFPLPKIRFCGRRLILHTSFEDLAQVAWRNQQLIPSIEVKIYLKNVIYPLSGKYHQSQFMHNNVDYTNSILQESRYFSQNKEILMVLHQTSSIAVFANDDSYRCKAILPFRNNEKHLSRSVSELINKPAIAANRTYEAGEGGYLSRYENNVGSIKLRAIKKALNSSDGYASIPYEDFWQGAYWEMLATAIVKEDEIVVSTMNANGEQRHYWEVISS